MIIVDAEMKKATQSTRM